MIDTVIKLQLKVGGGIVITQSQKCVLCHLDEVDLTGRFEVQPELCCGDL